MIAVCCLCESRRTAPVALFTYRSFDNWPPAVSGTRSTTHGILLSVDRERRSSCETLQNLPSPWHGERLLETALVTTLTMLRMSRSSRLERWFQIETNKVQPTMWLQEIAPDSRLGQWEGFHCFKLIISAFINKIIELSKYCAINRWRISETDQASSSLAKRWPMEPNRLSLWRPEAWINLRSS